MGPDLRQDAELGGRTPGKEFALIPLRRVDQIGDRVDEGRHEIPLHGLHEDGGDAVGPGPRRFEGRGGA